jgi:ABC-type bacteriocin/lantibiotic exporter with double-glycine peptidase domain
MRSIREYLKEIFYVLGERSRLIPFMALAFLGLSLLDVIGIGLIAPFLATIIYPDSSDETGIFSYILSLGFFSDYKEAILYCSIGLVLIFLMKSIVGVLINRMILKFCFSQGVRLRTYLMESYLSLPYESYINRNSSDYIYNIEQLANQYSQTILQSLLRVISESLIIIAIISLLDIYDLEALIILIVIIVVTASIYDLIFKKINIRYGKSVNESSSIIVKGIQEGVLGLKEIRILSATEFFLNNVIKASEVYARDITKAQLISQLPKYFLEFLLICFLVILIIFNLLAETPVESLVTTLSLFGFGSVRIIPSLNQVLSSLSNLRFSRDAMSRLYEDIIQLDNTKANLTKQTSSKNKLIDSFYKISFESVSFNYISSEKKVINDLNLTIHSGESIGLIGSSGSGKTTLVNIMLGLLNPSSGNIFYNNTKLNESIDTLRSKVAYLPQDVFITDDTVSSNIALGILPEYIDYEKVKLSISKAKLDSLLQDLPDGLDTVIGERGLKLSGGQKQRLAIARSFYFDKDIIIMDESTSSLDSQTEKEIIKEINQLKGEKTIIMIAHRHTTLEKCDRILELADGRVVNEHTYDNLIKIND